MAGKNSDHNYFFLKKREGERGKQARAELCQAQAQDGLAATASLN